MSESVARDAAFYGTCAPEDGLADAMESIARLDGEIKKVEEDIRAFVHHKLDTKDAQRYVGKLRKTRQGFVECAAQYRAEMGKTGFS